MTVTSTLAGIPGVSRRACGIGGRPGGGPAFGYAKLAVLLEGIHARYLQHQTVGEGLEQEGQAVPTLAVRAHRALDADAR